jgi:tRNA (guanine-N7-)-methyltransferase
LAKRLRIRQHVNPLKMNYQSRPVRPVGPGVSPEVEVGCADAQYLLARARVAPEGRYIGLEIREDLVDWMQARIAKLGLADQVAVMFANANTDLERLFAPEQVARFVVNFPDPWFKTWQHKRRLMTPELALAMASRLRSGGEVFFQSDVFELALDAMDVFERAAPALVNTRGPWSFVRENPFGAASRRETKSGRQGRRVWRMLYVRP